MPINVSIIISWRTVSVMNIAIEHFPPSVEVSGEIDISSYGSSSNCCVQWSNRIGHRSIKTSNSSYTLLDRGPLASSSQNVGRCSTLKSHQKRFDK